jgi:NADH dehydrogenase
LGELGIGHDRVEVVAVNRTSWHSIRVRNYEAVLADTRVSLDSVLSSIGVKPIVGDVTVIDVGGRRVRWSSSVGSQSLEYDRMVFAVGSHLVRPSIPGFAEHAFDVDTHEAALRLNDHVAELPFRSATKAQYNVVVIGGGLTGIEVATEMVGKLSTAIEQGPSAGQKSAPRVILADRQSRIGSDMGESAVPVIEEALAALGIEVRTGVSIASIDREGVTLLSGEHIAAATVVWCAGMAANPLTSRFPIGFCRLPVDSFLKVKGMAAEFAAGDAAWLPIDGTHSSVMSCQHARPMGRFAGYNVVSDLLGLPMLPLSIDWYTTILDLGAWGAVYTQGWDRRVVSKGAAAKRTKEIINRERIYPPRSGNTRDILAAAAPVVQRPPDLFE